MNNKVEVLCRRIYSMWKVFPLAVLAGAVVLDVVGLVTANGLWSTMSFYLMAIGIIGGVFAAVFGLYDYLTIEPDTRAKTIGLLQGGSNLIIVLLFAVSLYLRLDIPSHPSAAALLLSWIGIMLSLFSGWLGVELVESSGAAFDDEHIGHPHAPR